MTTADQDAVVGRLVRERRDLRAHHEALTANLQKIGDLLSGLGHALRIKPEHRPLTGAPVARIDQDGAVTVSSEYRTQEMLTGQFPTYEQIKQLLEERQNIASRISELDTQLKTFGV